jgi:hypothetical protein
VQTNLEWVVRSMRWLLPISILLTLIGYFGSWIGNPVAGLVVTGLDMGEYIKFLPSIIGGSIQIWREGFYLPLVTVSLTLSLQVFRPELRYGWVVRALLIAVAIMAALNLLPPAWTPQRMLTAEFRQQFITIGLLLAAVAFSPFLALLPRKVVGTVITIVALVAAWVPTVGFLRVLPDISLVYNRPQSGGWGIYVMLLGLILLATLGIVPWLANPQVPNTQADQSTG